MAETGTLHDAFIDELRDTYDAERQLTKALPKLAKAATSPELREAFESHLEETQGQIERLEAGVREPRREGPRQALRRHRRHHRRRQVGHGGGLRRRDDGRLPDCRRASAPSTTRWRPTARWSPGPARWVTTKRRICCSRPSTRRRRPTRSCRRSPRAASTRRPPTARIRPGGRRVPRLAARKTTAAGSKRATVR